MSSVREQQQQQECAKPQVLNCPGEMIVTAQTGAQVVYDQMKTEVCVTTNLDMYASKTVDSWNFTSTHHNSYREFHLFGELMHTDNSNLSSLPMVTMPSTACTFVSDFPMTDNTCLNQDIRTDLFTFDIPSTHQGAQSFAELSSSCQKYSSRTEKIKPPCNMLEKAEDSGTSDIYNRTSSSTSFTSEIVPESCLQENPFSIPIQEAACNLQPKSCSKQWNSDQSASDAEGTSNLPECLSAEVKRQSKESVDLSCVMGPSKDNSNASVIRCQVCGDSAAGFHCGAYVCEACKKFFIRTAKKAYKLMCSKSKQCTVTKKLRTLCQYCRYQKCLQLGMYKPGEGPGQGSERKSVLPCRVCSAPSSGYHFGAITCEGCKGFFRRMTKERDVTRFTCVKGGNCPVTQSTRNMCKACRYQKCFGVGMSADGSRIGRQPNAVKHATLLEIQSREMKSSNSPETLPFVHISSNCGPNLESSFQLCAKSCQNETDASHQSSTLNNVARSVAKHEHNQRTETYRCSPNTHVAPSLNISPRDKDSKMIRMVTNQSHKESISVTTSLKDIVGQIITAGQELNFMTLQPTDDEELTHEDFQDLATRWKDMMERFTYFTHGTLKFAKKIPGFRSLKLDDQASLLQTAAYPIVILSLSKCYNYTTKQFNYFNYSEQERQMIFQYIPGFQPLKEHFISTGDMVTMLKLDDIEQLFLAALILLSPDEGNVIEKSKVWEVQENIAAALQEYEEKTYEDGGTRFGVLITRLAEFRLINLQHQQVISTVIRENPSFKVPQLFSEMFLSS
ncbi:probable nuclear hormone receptor HR3 isoform X2 [Liolophura sinensis]